VLKVYCFLFDFRETGKPTAVILNIETYREMLALRQERLGRKESKLFPKSEHLRKR
jgi:hypothetical protein